MMWDPPLTRCQSQLLVKQTQIIKSYPSTLHHSKTEKLELSNHCSWPEGTTTKLHIIRTYITNLLIIFTHEKLSVKVY